MKKMMLTLVVSSIALAGTSLAAKKAPERTAAELLEKRCAGCHSAAKTKEAKKSSEEWEATVSRMMGMGANLTAAEKKTLVDYLAKNYKP